MFRLKNIFSEWFYIFYISSIKYIPEKLLMTKEKVSEKFKSTRTT